MSVFHADYSEIADIKKHVNQYRMWQYISRAGQPTLANTKAPYFDERLFLQDDALTFFRPKEEPQDTDWKHCGPRTELVLSRNKLSKNTPYHLHYDVAFDYYEGFKAIVLQLMDHNTKGKSLPCIQLEVRNEELLARWSRIENSTYRATRVHVLEDLEWGKRYAIDLFFVLSPDPNRGFFEYHVDGRLAFRWEGITSGVQGKVQVQYGVYGPPKMDLCSHVRTLSIREMRESEESEEDELEVEEKVSPCQVCVKSMRVQIANETYVLNKI
jgi:hypothetical protein